MPGSRMRKWAPAAAVVLTFGLTGCIDIFSPDCDDCPSDAHWENTCIGWIAPVCGTYCVSSSNGGVRLLDECCCGGKDLGKATLESASWRPLKWRTGTTQPVSEYDPPTGGSP